MADDILCNPCYAIQVKCRYEAIASTLLRLKGYDPFVPTYQERRRWSDRHVTVERPLLPGYVLCRLDIRNRLPVLSTEGVYGIVGHGKTPIPVDEQEIRYLQMVAASGLHVTPCSFHPGDRVRLEDGPLAGVEGTIIEVRKHYRLAVSISLLQRSVSVEVDGAWLRPLRHKAPGPTIGSDSRVALSQPACKPPSLHSNLHNRTRSDSVFLSNHLPD